MLLRNKRISVPIQKSIKIHSTSKLKVNLKVIILNATLFSGILLGADVSLNEENPDLVFRESFQELNGKKTIPYTKDSIPLSGEILGPFELITESKTPAIHLLENARILYRKPTMINIAEGTLEMTFKINFSPSEAAGSSNVVFFCLNAKIEDQTQKVIEGEARKGSGVMARLFLTHGKELIFGVNIQGEGDKSEWVLMIKKNIHWTANDIHQIKITWKDKINLFVDGDLVGTREAEGLFTNRIPASSVDLQKSTLYIGAEKPSLTSNFTVQDVKFYSVENKY